MVKLLLYPEGKFNFHALFALLTAVLAGAAAGGLAVIVNEAAGEIAQGRVHLRHLPFFIVDVVILIAARQIGLQQGIELVEQLLENCRNRITNLIRQAELLQMERLDHSDVYLKLTVNTGMISAASQSMMRACQSTVTILCVFAYIFHLSLSTGILFMGLLAAGVFYHRLHQRDFEEKNRAALVQDAALFTKFEQVLAGFKELKIDPAKRRELFEQDLRRADEAAGQARIRLGELRAKYDSVAFIFLFYFSLGCVAFLLPGTVSPADKFKIVAASAFLWEPISVLTFTIPEIFKAGAAADELADLEARLTTADEAVEYVHDPDGELPEQLEELHLEQIRFQYSDAEGKPVFELGPLSLTCRQGRTLFLVGGNGSGKSTLLKLIAGLYPPLSGIFLIDGLEARMTDLRHLFAPVFSDCHVFDGLYGIEQVDAGQVAEWLQRMCLNHKVRWTGRGFQYDGLSTGQMKRLALVAALLEDKPVYLFDEWAAEQDPAFKKYFYEELLPGLKAQGKMIIAATHDESYFHTADGLVHLEYGGISRQ